MASMDKVIAVFQMKNDFTLPLSHGLSPFVRCQVCKASRLSFLGSGREKSPVEWGEIPIRPNIRTFVHPPSHLYYS